MPKAGQALHNARWALPLVGAAALDTPATLYGLAQAAYSVPGPENLGFSQRADKYRKRFPFSQQTGALYEAAQDFAESQGAGPLAQAFSEMALPVPSPAKVGALMKAAPAASNAIGGLNLAVLPAFVGSPHRWDINPELGRLGTRMDKIGTGEGAQAFGYGHYSAERPGVADSYAHSLSAKASGVRYKGKEVYPGGSLTQELVDEFGLEMGDALAMVPGHASLDDAIETFEWNAKVNREFGAAPGQSRWDRRAKLLREHRDEIEILAPDANRYGVLHDVDYEDLLDWDAPLSQQSPKVREALKSLGFDGEEQMRSFVRWWEGPNKNEYASLLREAFGPWDSLDADKQKKVARLLRKEGMVLPPELESLFASVPEQSGENLYRALEARLGSDVAASQALREAGIPGSMFYDQMSRDAGKGTRNFVMYYDDLTYVDPARTDPALIGDMPLSAPYRTVGGAR